MRALGRLEALLLIGLGAVLVPVVMMAQSFSLVRIVEAQADYPFILVQPVSFAIFFIASMAESCAPASTAAGVSCSK